MHCLIPGAETFWIACGAGDLAIDQGFSFRPADFAKSELTCSLIMTKAA
tara:strand:+ start:210 stop:356 length:147 start_codon:yes stop_codon:yes gene_type:complete